VRRKKEGPFGLPLVLAKKVPVRVPVRVEEQDDGTVVIIYKKVFTRVERWIFRRFGGFEDIRRPLDGMGTDIWNLCDGEHNVAEICTEMHKKHGEDLEPVAPRVWTFIKMMADRNLVLIIGKKVPLEKKEGSDEQG